MLELAITVFVWGCVPGGALVVLFVLGLLNAKTKALNATTRYVETNTASQVPPNLRPTK